MATLSTTVSFLAILLLSSVFLAAAGEDAIKKVCAKTPYPEFCESAIAVHPDSKTSEDDQELVYWAVNSGYNFAAKASMAVKGSTEPCAAACQKNFDWAGADLSLAINEYPDYDAMIKDVRNLLDAAKKKNVEWNCAKCLDGKPLKDAAAIAKGNDLEKIMEVLSTFANPK
jgi:pectinesterase inhibitor-like protein